MVDFFLKEHYSLVTKLVEFLAAITGLILLKRYSNTNTRYFIYIIVYFAVVDFIGGYTYLIKDGFLKFLLNTKLRWNYWWYTLFYDVGAIVFIMFYFSKVLISKALQKSVKFLGFAFALFSIGYIISNWEAYFTGYFFIIVILGAVLVLISSVFYFIEVLSSDKILSFYKSINLYIVSIIFVWWLITTPLVFYEKYNFNGDLDFKIIKRQIYLLSNIFMYISFALVLIFCKPEKEINKTDG